MSASNLKSFRLFDAQPVTAQETAAAAEAGQTQAPQPAWAARSGAVSALVAAALFHSGSVQERSFSLLDSIMARFNGAVGKLGE